MQVNYKEHKIKVPCWCYILENNSLANAIILIELIFITLSSEQLLVTAMYQC